MEKKNRKCIVKDRRYNSFYHGGASYTTDLYEAKIYDENEVPNDIKNNPNLKVIPFNSKEGLEMITNEIQKTLDYISVKENSLKKGKRGLDELYSLINHNKT